MKQDADSIAVAIRQLDSESSKERTRAREALEEAGQQATRPLMQAVQLSGARGRHEALKALVHIADPAAMELFVETLGDDDSECRWLAAEGLAALGEAGLTRTLELVIEFPGKDHLLRSLHHVLSAFQRTDYLQVVAPVLRAFQSVALGAELPAAAHRALSELREARHARPSTDIPTAR